MDSSGTAIVGYNFSITRLFTLATGWQPPVVHQTPLGIRLLIDASGRIMSTSPDPAGMVHMHRLNPDGGEADDAFAGTVGELGLIAWETPFSLTRDRRRRPTPALRSLRGAIRLLLAIGRSRH
jgi:hypothetical protein